MYELSIIIPVYNNAKYLPECIESVINQVDCNFEIILVDDGSTDESGKICDQYVQSYENIKCIHKINEGACKARKDGAGIATGVYLGFVDSDDTVKSEYYSTLIKLANKYKADIVSSGFSIDNQIIVDDYSEGLYTGEKLGIIYSTMAFDIEKRRTGVLCSLCTKIIKKALFLEVMREVETKYKLWEDLSYVYKLLVKAHSIYISQYVGYMYRQNIESTSKKYDYYTFINTAESFRYTISSYNGYNNDIIIQIKYLMVITLYTEFWKIVEHSTNYWDYLNRVKKNNVFDIYNNTVHDIDEGKLFFKSEMEISQGIENRDFLCPYLIIKRRILIDSLIRRLSIIKRNILITRK